MKDIGLNSPEVKVGQVNDRKVSGDQKKVLLFMSSKSRSGESALDEVTRRLTEAGHSVLNDTRDSSIEPSQVILKNPSADLVIVGGGDGSVNLVLPALIKTKIPLLVIPLGTANNLARTYQLSSDLDKVLPLIHDHEKKVIDLGMVNEIPFASVVGLGLSTEINRLTPSSLKKWIGVFAFILTGIRLLFRMNPFRATIDADKKTYQSKSWQISVCNGKYYGSGLVIKHDATHEDQELHLLSTEVQNFWGGFSLIPSLMTGHYKSEQEVTLLSGRDITIKTHRKLKIDIDGDIRSETPAHFKVLPLALTLLVPKAVV